MHNAPYRAGIRRQKPVAHDSVVTPRKQFFASKTRIAQAVAAALMSVTAVQAWAACSPGTITTATSSAITFCTNDSLDVTSTGSIGVAAGSAISINNTNTTGNISNSGAISASSSGIVTLSTSSIDGGIFNDGSIIGGNTGINLNGTTVSNGIVNSGSIQGSSFTGLVVSTNSVINGGVNNSGSISGSAFGIYLSSSSTINGNVTNSGTISGGIDAIRVDAGGTLNGIHIAGNDTAQFIGAVNASTIPVYVESGATYTMNSGQQFTVQNFTNNGTLTVAAGATGTITGDYAQDAAATFQTNVSDDTTYGKLVVSAAATLSANAKINVNVVGSPSLTVGGTLAGVIQAGTLNATTFAVTDNSTLFNFTAAKNGNHVDLNIAAAAASGGPSVFSSVVNTGNNPATGAARTLDAIIASSPTGSMGDVVTALGQLSTEREVSNAVSQTLPLLNGGALNAVKGSLDNVQRIVQARLDSQRGLSSGNGFLGDKYLWLKPFGSRAGQDDRDGVAGYKSNTYGVAFGADGKLNAAFRLGAAFAYATSDINGRSTVARQNADVDTYQLIGYGSYDLDERTALDFQADLGKNTNEGRRQVAFMGSTAISKYDSQTAHLGAALGRSYALSSQTTLTPSIRADYTWVKDTGYTERGADALNLTVNSRSVESFIVGADGKLAHRLNDQTTVIANLGLGYDTINKLGSVTAAFAGAPGASFVTYGIKLDPWLVRGGLGTVYKTRNGLEISARYDVEYRESFLNQTASANLRWAF